MVIMVVTLEVSKLSGWLKADAPCRVEEGMQCGGERCEPGGGRAWGVVAARQAACTGKRPDSRLGGQGHALERTQNMPYMVVTLEVSQPEMSALKFVKPRKSSRMSVMAETSQSAMGPYVLLAAVGLALYAWTAVTSRALVVKV
jgi:hypothetical protein